MLLLEWRIDNQILGVKGLTDPGFLQLINIILSLKLQLRQRGLFNFNFENNKIRSIKFQTKLIV